ncbi:DUF1499 domain-containing protein [filamentous cyanobacterium CCT1]|nr:DUF1499 domain-containing protein [filamentous cyanobacterium CCT1]PSN78392.1 DUF1499 domain-containing protein [filamentous cyanobacterium CCP4]
MSTILAGWLAIALWLTSVTLPAPAPPLAPGLGALPGLSFAGEAPELGVQNGQLSPCPQTPNCWVSQGADAAHAIAPIEYSRDRATARDLLLKVLKVVPRTEIVAQTDDYIRAKSTSRLLGFVDDLEFYLPPEEHLIHLRSAARLGESDLGVNRRRLEQIRLALRDLGI